MDTDDTADRSIRLARDHLDRLSTLNVYADKAGASALGYGWWASIVRMGEAVRRLFADGYGHEAAPLMRSVLDHTVSLIWLAQESQAALRAYLWHRGWKQHGLYTTAEVLGWADELSDVEVPPEPAKGDRPAEAKYLFNPAALAEHIGWASIYMGFMVETSFVHPSTMGADHFVASDEGEIAIFREPQGTVTPLTSTAMFVGLSTRALEKVLEGRNPELNALADGIGALLGHDLHLPVPPALSDEGKSD